MTELKKEDEGSFLCNLKDFVRGFLKIGMVSNAPNKCIGCGKCGPGRPCPFGAKKLMKPTNKTSFQKGGLISFCVGNC